MSLSRSSSSIYLTRALAEHSLSLGTSPFFDSIDPKAQVVPSIAAACGLIFGISFISSGVMHQRFPNTIRRGKLI